MNDDGWALVFTPYFVYDYITNEDIKKALTLDLSNIDITTDWINVPDKKDGIYITAYTNTNKHILRVAKLVQELKQNKQLTPICVFFDDSAFTMDISNYIEDGNHRIRALQYLNYTHFPAYIYGNFLNI